MKTYSIFSVPDNTYVSSFRYINDNKDEVEPIYFGSMMRFRVLEEALSLAHLIVESNNSYEREDFQIHTYDKVNQFTL